MSERNYRCIDETCGWTGPSTETETVHEEAMGIDVFGHACPKCHGIVVFAEEAKRMSYPYTDKFEALKAIADACHQNSDDHGWWPERTPEDRLKTIPTKLMLVVSECSEALEEYRDGRMEERFDAGHGTTDKPVAEDGQLLKPVGFPSELADIVIRVFDLAGALGVDIAEAIYRKMAFNQTRPFRHGGKAV